VVDELQQLSALIADIYDAPLIQNAWCGILAKVGAFVDGTSATFYSQNSSSRQATQYVQWGGDPHYERLYFETYYKLNPLAPATSFVDPGIVFSQSDLIPYEEFEETRFYKEWVAPQGFVDVIGANLEKSATSAAMFAIRRNARQGRVDGECRRKLGLVVPHLRRAVLIGNVIDDHKMTAAALNDTFMALADAVFLVDPRARIVFANAAADGLLREGKIVRGRRANLAAVDVKATSRRICAICSKRPTVADRPISSSWSLGTRVPSCRQPVRNDTSSPSSERMRQCIANPESIVQPEVSGLTQG
jgi:hypothetical protein